MAGTVVTDNIQAASTSTLVLKNGVASTPPTIQDSAGTEIGTFCRAWVNFNGTGTVAIRADFNVSSITDNGTGDYTVNFTTAMPDANYDSVVSCGGATIGLRGIAGINMTGAGATSAPTTTAFRMTTYNAGGPAAADADYVSASFFR